MVSNPSLIYAGFEASSKKIISEPIRLLIGALPATGRRLIFFTWGRERKRGRESCVILHIVLWPFNLKIITKSSASPAPRLTTN